MPRVRPAIVIAAVDPFPVTFPATAFPSEYRFYDDGKKNIACLSGCMHHSRRRTASIYDIIDQPSELFLLSRRSGVHISVDPTRLLARASLIQSSRVPVKRKGRRARILPAPPPRDCPSPGSAYDKATGPLHFALPFAGRHFRVAFTFCNRQAPRACVDGPCMRKQVAVMAPGTTMPRF